MSSISLLMLLQIISLGFSANDRDMEISFIIDFMKTQTSPRTVFDHLCWNKDHKLDLQRKLTKHNYCRYRSFSDDSTLFEHFYHPYFFTVLVSIECDFEYFLKKALDTTLVRYPNVWIVFGEFEILKKLNYFIPIYSFFVIPTADKNRNYVEIKTIYKINNHFGGYIEKLIGNWSKTSQIYDFKNIILVRERINLKGMPLRVSYVVTDNATFKHFTDYRDRHVDNYTKVNYALYNFICDLLNATQIRVIASTWGFEQNATFSKGMFEDLVNNRSDIAGTVSFTPSSRLKYFRYLFPPIKDFSVHFVFRAPSLAYYTNLFVLPFDNMVWLTIGFLLMFCSILINIIFTWETKEEAFIEGFEENKENFPTFLDVIMMQIAIMCQMDFFYEPKSISGRIATFLVLILFTFIYTAFSARIVLLLQSNTNKIRDMDGVYAANFEFGVEDQPYNRYYFKGPSDRANEHWRKLIYENKIKRPGGDRFFSAPEGMNLVRDSYFAFHTEQTVANYLIDKTFSKNQKCSLQFVDTIYKSGTPYLPVPRNSPFLEFFAISFRKLCETGLMDREQRRSFNKRPSCDGRAHIFVSVGLIETYFAFVVFGSGVCLSIIILAFENLAYTYFKIRCSCI